LETAAKLVNSGHKEIESVNGFGWAFWEGAYLVGENDNGDRLYVKDGYGCWCKAGTLPGDADSQVVRLVEKELDREGRIEADEALATHDWDYRQL
jgi:hypothetical protein